MAMLGKKHPPLKEARAALEEISLDSDARFEYDIRQANIYFNERAIREGKEESREEGRHENACKIARAMLAEKLPLDQVIRITGLSREEIENLR